MTALAIQFDPAEHLTLVELRADLELKDQIEVAADFARKDIEVVQRYNEQVTGYRSPYTVEVDGRLGAPLESVKPYGGEIVVEFQLANGIIGWIGDTLIDRSPFHTGEYIRGHRVIIDGEEHTLDDAPLENFREAIFYNKVPYARKIELGKTESGRDFVISVPNRIYRRTAEDARDRFRTVADVIYYDFHPAGVGRSGRWPAIFVRMRNTGGNLLGIGSNTQTALRLLG